MAEELSVGIVSSSFEPELNNDDDDIDDDNDEDDEEEIVVESPFSASKVSVKRSRSKKTDLGISFLINCNTK